MRGFLARHFLSIDPRTLALTRVGLAILLLLDLAKRAGDISVWYTDTGLLPRFAVWEIAPYGYSFFWKLNDKSAVLCAFCAIAIVYLALLVGFFTKLAHALSLVCILSLQQRVQPLTSGGDIVTCILCWWTLFLPLGSYFSVDAFLARRRDGDARSAGLEPVLSIAVFGALCQLAIIYFFNALQKDGVMWRTGTAVHYLLWLDRINTPVAVWAREFLPLPLVRVLTWATRITEGILPLLILSPFGKPWTRRLAIALIVSLHAGISTFVNVGPFSLAMIAFSTLLVSTADWDAIQKAFGRSAEPAPRSEATSYARSLRDVRIVVRELGAVALFCVVGFQALRDNRAVPVWLKPAASPFLGQVVARARLGQLWAMFSPDIAEDEVALAIDATTVDGGHVDPFNEVALGDAAVSLDLGPNLGYDVFFHHYAQRMPEMATLQPAFDYWVKARATRTGNPRDRIVTYRAYVLVRKSPKPGERKPWPTAVREFLHD